MIAPFPANLRRRRPVSGRPKPGSDGIRTRLQLYILMRFLDANRGPPRIKPGAGFRSKTLCQASWSIRVPCPGGSGACAGWAELASSASLSLLGAGGVLGWLLLTTGVTGGVAETLDILM
jgi:hypothetical protein